MKKIMILGGNGMLGRALQPYWSDEEVVIVSRKSSIQIDVRDLNALMNLLEVQNPDIIIHCAAVINFVWCEDNPNDAMQVNAFPCGVIAEYCIKSKAKFVYISSDSTQEPVNMYGKSKLEGENLAKKDKNALIIRTNIVGDKSFGKWAYETIREARECVLFEDYITSGIDVWSFGQVLKILIDKDKRGIWNIGSHHSASKASYMREMARLMGQSLTKARLGSVTMIQPRRNPDCTLDVSKVEKVLGYDLPDMKQVCEAIVKKLKEK